jgi:hypothetical protein
MWAFARMEFRPPAALLDAVLKVRVLDVRHRFGKGSACYKSFGLGACGVCYLLPAALLHAMLEVKSWHM